MLPFIILGTIAIGTIVVALVNGEDEKLEITKESDCSDQFLLFNKNISITTSKRRQLIASRKVLQNKIKEHFISKSTTVTPSFYIQGSYKHGTLIRKQDDTCDIDLGIYFKKKPGITALTIQNNLMTIFGNHTDEKGSIKNKCVRIYYANLFHIDLPIFCHHEGKCYIGTGKEEWIEDNPKLFTSWLKEQTNGNEQKIRVIKYLKAWADVIKTKQGQKMPSGLALTLWVLNYFQGNEREDLAFLNTIIGLRNYLKDTSLNQWECKMPTIPKDNVIEKLTKDQRENFLAALNNLVDHSSKIITSNSKEECILKWKLIFGKWF